MVLPGEPSIDMVLREATQRLADAGIDAPRRDARLLLAHALGTGVEALLGWPERPVAATIAANFAALIERRSAREPVSRLLGFREFWSLRFQVTPAVLDPRPDSESLIEALLGEIPDRDLSLGLLDLGTGSGCLLLALLQELPRAKGLGIDFSPEALAVAEGNAAALGLAARAEFQLGDWCKGLVGRFDVVVTNPPYIPEAAIDLLEPEVAQFDPRPALSGGADGLDAYRAVIPQIACVLRAGGIAAIEVGDGQAAMVEQLVISAGLASLGYRSDLRGTARCVLARSVKGLLSTEKNVWKSPAYGLGSVPGSQAKA